MVVVGPAGSSAWAFAGSYFSGLAFTGVSVVSEDSMALAVTSDPPSLHAVKPAKNVANVNVVMEKRMG